MSSKRRKGRKTRDYPFPAKMANGRTWYFRSEEEAEKSRRASWANARSLERSVEISKRFRTFTGDEGSVSDAYPFYGRVNGSEQKFLRWAFSRSIQVGRNGWPDFYCKSPSGGLAAVEVKHGNDVPSPEQLDCYEFLEKLGVPVFLFHPAWSKRNDGPALIPWRQYVAQPFDAGWPEMDSGGKAAGQSLTSAQSDLDLEPAHENPASETGRTPELLGDPQLLH